MAIVKVLKRCEIFLGLDDRELQELVGLPSCREETYEAQEVIFKKGEEARCVYVLEEGQAILTMEMPMGLPELPKQTVVRTITKGGVFGWAALVPPHVRIMSAISKGPSKSVVISGSELRALFDKDPHLGYEVVKSLLRVIGSRVWNIEQLLITGKRSPFLEKPKAV